MSNILPTLVVGAGIAGITCAKRLASAGQPVVLADKGGRAGGRLTTRVSRTGPTFDQGAQYLTAKSVTFQNAVRAWSDAGALALWDGRFVDLDPGKPPRDTERLAKRYVGVPGMASILEHELRELAKLGVPPVRFNTRIARLHRLDEERGWQAVADDERTLGPFGRVVLAIPAPQAIDVLGSHSADLTAELETTQTLGCWTLMLAFKEALRLPVPFAAAFLSGPELSSVAHNSGKPGRPDVQETGDCWTIHADHAWSAEHLEDDADQVVELLTAALGRALGVALPAPSYAAAHRWRYAHVVTPLAERWLFDDGAQLGVCGDLCSDGSPANIERAWLSGLALGEKLV